MNARASRGTLLMMTLRGNCLLMLSASLWLLSGCAPHSNAEAAAAPHAAAQTAPEPKQSSACEMVTAAEMTVLLGGSVSAHPGPTNGQTSCTYTAVSGASPYAELKVEWGSGEGGMVAAGLLNAHEPGITDPLAGVGDQAVSIGPTAMIKRGDDLVTIILSGVDDVFPHVKAIYALVDKRMGHE
jgi:hypothetical protein